MSEVQLLQKELGQLPTEQRESMAEWFRHELRTMRAHDQWFEQLSDRQVMGLRTLVDEGVASGDAGVLDMAEIIREAQAEWDCRASD
ncbi:MAG: hypothetical protein AAGJ10_05320 [Bacteroidota bacterium]